MTSILLTTTGTPATVTITDLGNITFVHPVVDQELIIPIGDYTLEEIQESLDTGGDLLAAIVAGEITLTDGNGNSITNLNDAQLADSLVNGIAAVGKTSSAGVISNPINLTVNRPSVGVYNYSFIIPLPNAEYSVFGLPYNVIDPAVETDLNLFVSNLATTGFTITTRVGDNGTATDVLTDTEHSVTVVSNVFSTTPAQLPGDNLGNHTATTTLDLAGNNLDNLGNVTNLTGSNIVTTATQGDYQITATDGAGTSSLLFLNQETPGFSLLNVSGADFCGFICASNALNMLIDATSDFQINSDPGTIGQVMISQGAGVPPIYDNLNINNLSNVDIFTTPALLNTPLTWDGTNYVPNNNVRYQTNGCMIDMVDDSGLDFCNNQVGTNGSAFYIARKALGTIAAQLPVTDGIKIGGYSFLANDGVTTSPGYVGAEISSVADGDQTAINGGANLRFEVTENGTKATVFALEIEDDGTLSVAGQTDYENKVIDDDDIPNWKAVTDRLIEGYAETDNGGDNGIDYNNTTPLTVSYSGTNFSNNTLLVWLPGSNEFRTDFAGQVSVSGDLNWQSAGTRNHVTVRIVRDRGGVLTTKRIDSTYKRNTGGHNRDSTNGSKYFDCQVGDLFYIEVFQDGTNGTAGFLNDWSTIAVRRIG